ncbi:hypothetical protein [Rufibacter sp. DG15C]|uniref:hypothetical protein n=1 Tax=Rufibacter sp. DG15C TaxID=1379909 RepID=UPI0012F82657|nr:hypothetical protein [Rufibacter sp. DG15C]
MLTFLWLFFRQVRRWIPGLFRCLESVCAYRPAYTQWRARAKKVWRFVLQKLSIAHQFSLAVFQGNIINGAQGVSLSVSKAVRLSLYLVHHRILT